MEPPQDVINVAVWGRKLGVDWFCGERKMVRIVMGYEIKERPESFGLA